MAEAHTTTDAAACSTEFFSAHVESLREALSRVDVNDEEARVEAEIEASKAHWSELTSVCVTAAEGPAVGSSSTSTLEWEGLSEVERIREENARVARDNVEMFRILQAKYPGGFFVDENDLGLDDIHKLPLWMFDEDGKYYREEFKLSSEKPFVEGAQAQLFHAHVVYPNDERIDGWVMKVFKAGTFLRDLQRLLPPSMLNVKETLDKGCFSIDDCNVILGAWLLKSDGKFAFIMLRLWGDLRKLIDLRMLHDNNQGSPFPNDIATYCIGCIALGMQSLHATGIVHRDLKAANVLIYGLENLEELSKVDPILLNPYKFTCAVADFECSVGVVGTRFWRAPEILLAMKNRNMYEKPEIFNKEVDVYSFGMTCYEILTGRIPLEELRGNDYDEVIGGVRSILPRETPP